MNHIGRVICIGKLWLVHGGILGWYQMCERICRLYYGAGLCIRSEYEDSPWSWMGMVCKL